MRLRGSLTGCFLLLGLAFRTWHYLRGPSVWHDEAALLLNVIGKNFTELLGPLFFAEAAPPLFLWLERAVFLVLGDGAAALRLLPFLAGCTSLLLVAWSARRLLAPAAVPWAVLLFAASDRLLWHCCEAKPYAVDMLVSALVIAWLAVRDSGPLTRLLLLLAALAPLLIFLSFPACFVLGGLLVVLLPGVARQRRLAPWAAYGLLVLAVLGAFAFLVLGPVHAQRAAAMESCWVHQFPPWQEPWRIPTWTLFSTLDVLRYCFEPVGHVLVLPAAIGAICLWRRSQRGVVVLVLLPLLLTLTAAFLGAYPYGGARVEAFAAPGLALLVAAGVPPVWTWLQTRVRFGGLALAAVLLTAPLLAAYHVLVPWRRFDNAGAAAYVLDHRLPGDMVVGNLWQDAYYFRCLGPAFELLNNQSFPPNRRLWVVLSAWTAPQREELVVAMADRHPILIRREFRDTTVILLEREAPDSSAGLYLPAGD